MSVNNDVFSILHFKNLTKAELKTKNKNYLLIDIIYLLNPQHEYLIESHIFYLETDNNI